MANHHRGPEPAFQWLKLMSWSNRTEVAKMGMDARGGWYICISLIARESHMAPAQMFARRQVTVICGLGQWSSTTYIHG